MSGNPEQESTARGREALRRLVFGDDHIRRTNIKRQMMALGSYLVCYAFVVVCYLLGMTAFSFRGMLLLLFLLVAPNLVFWAMLRSGFSERFRDPSMMFPQLYAGLLVVAYGLYHASEARPAMMLSYLFIYMFGLFRLSTVELMRVGTLAVLSYGAVVLLAWRNGLSGLSLRLELLQWLALVFITPWFAFMGGAITRLRLRLRARNAALTAAMDRIRVLAAHDEVTGAFNRHFILGVLEREAAAAARSATPFSICLLDVDHFKNVNDSYGHAAGDQVLRRVSELARQDLRSGEYFARYGGEEFLLALPATGLRDALSCAERIRTSIGAAPLRCEEGDIPVTVSIGVAEFLPGETVKQMIGRADKALYRAKHGGRNRSAAA
ncbi:MAG TPA: GGDEF domain-containing protein [Noviherbaspirillum sp.]|jgi:diguanylate cyclase (GGDEF)-like protein|uniref:GGDEF domain-containing protein n=1 Tax=Noviherbaspirillum sp. TaxID=1926288 RepID=UPI002F921A75